MHSKYLSIKETIYTKHHTKIYAIVEYIENKYGITISQHLSFSLFEDISIGFCRMKWVYETKTVIYDYEKQCCYDASVV